MVGSDWEGAVLSPLLPQPPEELLPSPGTSPQAQNEFGCPACIWVCHILLGQVVRQGNTALISL